MYCPDLKNQNYSLKNKHGDMQVNSLIFRVEKCEDPAEQPGFCKTNDIIEKFVKDLRAQIWIIDPSIDLSKLHEDSLMKR